MDWNQISGLWAQYGGQAKANWGQLTDNDITAIRGSREALIGKLQTRYGIDGEQAGRQVDTWLGDLAFAAASPFAHAAETMAGPAQAVMGKLGEGVAGTIRNNRAVAFGSTALACFLLGMFWKRIIR